MEEAFLQVQMLGRFSISCGDRQITSDSASAHAPWLLLAYLLCGRSRSVSRAELASLLEGASSSPEDALSQARRLLDSLGDDLGHKCILCQEDGCRWSPEVPVLLDIDSYEALCMQGVDADDGEARLFCGLQALALYQGDFLPQLAQEPWAEEQSAYFRQSFTQIALNAVLFLRMHNRREEATELCHLALRHAPDHQELLQNLHSLMASPDVSDGIVDDTI